MNKLSIKIYGNEQEIIEGCLNLASSGVDPSLPLAFVALSQSWNVDKLIYYQNLIYEVMK